ncbi:hypothetical protein Mp_8g18900 [Marchantia polymorpha subsp. ruderalis]|uniref:Uncharacterized protein n=1 Tax=Marchantia polymorpha TaxID=3197 RepID=A0A2R6W831_MARPO|nr:hypothetical protein MARPO_0131s0014 [Marchantia polymorpha]BBN20413.1 hypothetical protein Mp_8g18900 [Marchantia polymorpha subsp. ruderalis]|eukprot:PTQ30015.1 hypothetical protein MARPO_0131s0014 [Marchantia polymorpha]
MTFLPGTHVHPPSLSCSGLGSSLSPPTFSINTRSCDVQDPFLTFALRIDISISRASSQFGSFSCSWSRRQAGAGRQGNIPIHTLVLSTGILKHTNHYIISSSSYY